MAFTPYPAPVSGQRLSEIIDGLRTRADERQKKWNASRESRETEWQAELACLRTRAHLDATQTLQAQLHQHAQQTTQKEETSYAAVYHARMAKHGVSEARGKTHRTFAGERHSLVAEPLLPGAPIRKAIRASVERPALAAAHEEIEEIGRVRKEGDAVEKQMERSTMVAAEEQVQRPSLVDAVVALFGRVAAAMGKPRERVTDEQREADLTAGSAVAQLLAVFVSLGKI